MRAAALLLAAALLAPPCAAQQLTEDGLAQHQAKLSEYIAAGWSPDAIIAGLNRWFGWNHEVMRARDVFVVLRRPDGEIYYLQFIGTLPEQP